MKLLSAFAGILVCSSCTIFKSKSQKEYILIAKQGKYVKENGHNLLLISVVFINNTKDTLRYIEMACPVNSTYAVQSTQLIRADEPITCTGNMPVIKMLAPAKSKSAVIKYRILDTASHRDIKLRMAFYLYKDPELYMKFFFLGQENILPRAAIILSNTIKMKAAF
jgi:hypothetical protein